MEDHDRTNPIASVDALVDPAPLTMARIAMLSRVNSPVMFGHTQDVSRCVEALYLTKVPVAAAARSIKAGTLSEDSLSWADAELSDTRTYAKEMCALLDAITAFWKMLPNGDSKKKASGTETAG